jgi:hypothetical protein
MLQNIDSQKNLEKVNMTKNKKVAMFHAIQEASSHKTKQDVILKAAQEIAGEYTAHVVYSRQSDGELDIIIFVDEFDNVADAEEKKAKLNRELPIELSDCLVSVGIAMFYAHPENEDLDLLVVHPKDGTPPFSWGDIG